jgi:hypothetical protein
MHMNIIRFSLPLTVSVLLTALFWGSANNAAAQTKPYNEEITVVAPFDPIIPDAFKISRNPAISDTLSAVPVMNYSVMPRRADVTPVIEPLPAVKLLAEPLSKLYRNYLRAGAGNNASLYGELTMSSLRSKTYLVSIHLKHQSSAGKIQDFGPPGNSKNEAEASVVRYFDEHSLSGKAFYERDGFHLYGFRPADYPDTVISADELKQHFFTTGASIGFASHYKADDKVNHNLVLDYAHTGGSIGQKEDQVKFSAALDRKFDLLKLGKPQILGLSAGYSYLNQQDTALRTGSGILLFNPYMKASYNEYSFMAGFIVNISTDSVTKGHLYPMAEARLELIPGGLNVFAGISGGLERTSLRRFTEENLYLSPVTPWNYTNDKFRIYGGFQSNISRSFNFNGTLSSSTYENFPFFVTDTAAFLLNSFTLVYDNVNAVKIRGEFEYVKSERLRLSLTGEYNHYKTSGQEYAWYKPTWVFEFSGRYDLQKKIVVTARASINSAVWAPVPVNASIALTPDAYILEPQQLKGWADISLGTEYRFTKALSFWLNFNNLAATKYFRWYNYRSYGFNLLGGASYSF